MLIENEVGQVMLFDPDLDAGKMCPVLSVRPPGMTSKRSSRSSSTLKNHSFMLLDLRPGAGNMLGPCWEINPVWLGPPGTLNTSECPKGAAESSLSQILVATAPSRYYLSQVACLGILRRAEERGKELPSQLIRRLMPIECERLQGYPDGWTDIPGASDSSRYKALGNSVAIPCVELLIMGIAFVIRDGRDNYSTVGAMCRMLERNTV